jgi:hypothetical protein
MSVVLGDDLLVAGRQITEALAEHTDFALAEITAGFARATCNQAVYRRSTAKEPDHAEVEGNKTDSVRKKMAKAAVWVIRPQQCCLHATSGFDCPACANS